jgi:2-C-methyl-D-erythritol 4-phosphate cytidylyltransferase
VVAGGTGRRFGGAKQFSLLGGRPVAAWSIAAARSVADGVVLVVPSDDPEPADLGADRTVAGGETRAASVRAGLAAVPEDASVIVVHDAARPLASASLFGSVVALVADQGAAGAIPVLAVGDTLKRLSGDTVAATVDREGLVTVQTPQAFEARALRDAHASQREAPDDAGLLELRGLLVRTVAGESRNVKITRPEDLELAELYLSAVHG